MKISKLIVELLRIENKHGDLETFVEMKAFKGENALSTVETLWVKNNEVIIDWRTI